MKDFFTNAENGSLFNHPLREINVLKNSPNISVPFLTSHIPLHYDGNSNLPTSRTLDTIDASLQQRDSILCTSTLALVFITYIRVLACNIKQQ